MPVTLTLPSLSFAYEAFYKGRTDARARIYDAAGVLVAGLTITVTEENLSTEQADYRVNVSGVPTSYAPGKCVFDFADDPAIRTAQIDLAAYVLQAARLIEMAVGWPTEADVERRLSAAGVTLKLAGADRSMRMAEVLAEVVEEVEKVTRRQFISDTIPTIRRFDGRGSSELAIDEMVDLDLVEALDPAGAVLHAYTGAALRYEGPGRPLGTLYTRHDGVASISRVFPLGRGNVRVTGIFGYAASVPPDLFDAVADEVAHRLGQEAVHQPEGRIVDFSDNGFSEKHQLEATNATGWTARYESTLLRYSKDLKGGKKA